MRTHHIHCKYTLRYFTETTYCKIECSPFGKVYILALLQHHDIHLTQMHCLTDTTYTTKKTMHRRQTFIIICVQTGTSPPATPTGICDKTCDIIDMTLIAKEKRC